ncbi:universal stress protein [Vibrio genomosp. F6]|uniref:Universal stress protein F n=1 Tax=Vibrio genomosp. F6 TaxID=723172 RepID=A0A0H4A170_9VIBR|nr:MULTISPECIES: universal stress protein [Vibrio]RBW66134.1 universal stress protein [Vibrionales bacterium C3R12]AKN39491.1 Universal stress protein F [Vibrio genomosp. F6]MDN3697533.1 universal stress protein [Vibrio cortegadensis]NOH85465.1 universal stress protein [Vibrio sp. 03-59-1]TKF16664.1 universal stress protein [Vibrio genomosp. F6]
MSLQRILMPVDLAYPEVVKREVNLALKLIAEDGVIDMLYVDEARVHRRTVPTASGNVFSTQHQSAFDSVQTMLEQLVPKPHLGKSIVRCGVVFDEVVLQAKKSNSDAIVMASSRPRLRSYLLGSNAAKIVRHSHCSVFVVK